METLQSYIPEEIWDKVKDKKVTEAGFGAGPACMVGDKENFNPPANINKAFKWLEKYRSKFVKCHIEFKDKSRLWFDRTSFMKYETISGNNNNVLNRNLAVTKKTINPLWIT